MIRALSTASSNISCSFDEHPSPSPSPSSSSETHRFTLHSLVSRLSDSKNNLLEQIPHHQRRLTRLKKRTKSFLSSTLNDRIIIRHSSSCDRQNSSDDGIVSLDEIYRRNHATHPDDINSYDIDGIPAPKLLQTSILINEELSKQILRELPPRLHSRDWYMIFSTEENGFSLSTLYRRSFEIDHDSPSLIIIKDVEQNIFGAFVPHQLLISEGFYGTGESFLFTLHPEFRVFNWSGDNEFFVKGDVNSLGFGIGEGTYALWLDGNLYRGRSCATKTFNNEILSSNEDFIIASIEVWTFTG
ncbi:unnamed protein product [Adineta steineri]|uniref:Oxidation resistance protein 1 n=1 Tax=Adineta steineri TaxID=433720 RepID=A0A813NYE0_9BILA|nr:unnamed protein product [Adineta steineri]CAF1071389.1 unnamed protein product [Adineta steineri]CAF3534072.1 unnamed protein product [Adineta steineri]CAF3640681.1 unnamed protein product [Adineta steineri]